MFPKYVSLYHRRHCRIGLSEGGNDFFFFVLISALRGIRVVLVIRPFITLPARHSAVWVNAISPDSHNYPKIERGREISLTVALWVRRSLGKYTERLPKCFFNRASSLCLNTSCLFGEYVYCLSPTTEINVRSIHLHSAECEIFCYHFITYTIQLH